MSATVPEPGVVTEQLVAQVRALAPAVRAEAEATERGRRLAPAMVERLATAGVFRMCIARSLGGAEVDAATMARVIEEVARADGSTGWCVMIGATSGLISGYLEGEAAREIYGSDPSVITGGVFAPRGKAVVEKGGYRANGRWPFASGSEHCTWLMGGCIVVENGKPRTIAEGTVETRLVLFPKVQATIHDTWSAAGLCGTGSHDMEVKELLVPAAHSVGLTYEQPREDGPIYKFPVFGLLAVGIAAVTLGIARDAIDELTALAADKTPTGSGRRLAARSVVQAEVAQAEAELGAGRAYLFDSIARAWEEASRGMISIERRTLLRLAATQATVSAARAVDRMYNAGGGTSVYASCRLQRAFRDVHVATQHAMVAPATWELTGRLILGLETDTATL